MWLLRLAIPFAKRIGHPVEFLLVVATHLAARIGGAQARAQVGTGDANAVIRSLVDDHVGRLGHMAFHTQRAVGRLPLVDLLVKMMCGGVVGVRPVTPRTQGVAFLMMLAAVHIVAIGAAYILAVHFALNVRAPDVVLFENLSIGVVDPLVE